MNDIGERLAPEVAGYVTDRFFLKEDLVNLERVSRLGAHEATVIYSTRIMEMLAAESLKILGLEPGSLLFPNLQLLEWFNLIPKTTLSYAHALRRIGNDVRHVSRRINASDASLATAFLEPFMDWFFCRFRYGLQLRKVAGDDSCLSFVVDTETSRIISAFERAVSNPQALFQLWVENRESLFALTPVLPALLAEILIGLPNYPRAEEVCSHALTLAPDDLRLHQLMGLCKSRQQELSEALKWLEPLYSRYKDDEETAGITAGVYKRYWQQNGDETFLRKSFNTYRQGWESSKRRSAYLGINAAATAFWLNRFTDANSMAGEVCQMLRDRIRKIRQRTGDEDFSLNYWDQATLAEARLLLGELSEARTIYGRLFHKHPERVEDIRITKKQMGYLLESWGVGCTVDEFLSPVSEPEETPGILVGVTGHRSLPKDPGLTRAVIEALNALRKRAPDKGSGRIGVLSSLAEGANRLVAFHVLSSEPKGTLHAILPLPARDYMEDFHSSTSRQEFVDLLNSAHSVLVTFQAHHRQQPIDSYGHGALESQGSREVGIREAAYERSDREVVDRCDVLLALWDGAPARGRGGTAEIVAYARNKGKPVVWVQTRPPYDIIYERLVLRQCRIAG